MEWESYSRPTYNNVHSATTRSTVVDVIHKLTVDEFIDHTNTPTTCWGEISKSKRNKITHVTLTTPTQRMNHHMANILNGQPVYKISSL